MVRIRRDLHVATRLNLTRLLVVIHRVRMHNDRTYTASIGTILTRTARNNSHFNISAEMKNGRTARRHVALCALGCQYYTTGITAGKKSRKMQSSFLADCLGCDDGGQTGDRYQREKFHEG